jgi:hypothetical protein
MIPEEDWQELAYNLSTFTVDLSLPDEPVKWGHLSPEGCRLLVEGVKSWLRQYDGDGQISGEERTDG